jgi:glycosyltransferase involved in cell wall biosynthesis
VAGNGELIINGVTGFLVDHQHIEELPVMLDRLVSDGELAKAMGLAGRRRVEELFQMKDIAGRFFSLWKTFLLSNGAT